MVYLVLFLACNNKLTAILNEHLRNPTFFLFSETNPDIETRGLSNVSI